MHFSAERFSPGLAGSARGVLSTWRWSFFFFLKNFLEKFNRRLDLNCPPRLQIDRLPVGHSFGPSVDMSISLRDFFPQNASKNPPRRMVEQVGRADLDL